MYKPVLESRLFRPDTRYADIEWTDFESVVQEFRGRMDAWYFTPTRRICEIPHSGFAETALTCLLIDALSQYRFGERVSAARKFKRFVREDLELAEQLPTPVRRGEAADLVDLADVLYHGFRCGILHEAHVPLFGAIEGQEELVTFNMASTTYVDEAPCLTVVIDPGKLLARVEGWFNDYIERLLNGDAANDDLRAAFKRKFEWSFGVPA